MQEQKFEDALKNLEAIVSDLENGELNLDDAIKKYEEGMKLSGLCYKRLEEIQKRVEVLVKDSSGKLKTKELKSEETQPQEPPSDTTAQKRKQAVKRKRPKGEELLF